MKENIIKLYRMGYPYTEIAAKEGVSINTIKNLIMKENSDDYFINLISGRREKMKSH